MNPDIDYSEEEHAPPPSNVTVVLTKAIDAPRAFSVIAKALEEAGIETAEIRSKVYG